MRMCSEGWPTLALASAPFAVAAGGAAMGGMGTLALVFCLAGLGAAWTIAFFFRDPARTPPDDPTSIVAGADGLVDIVTLLEDPIVGPGLRISVYLGLMDVHINRVPAGGIVTSVTYVRGRHRFTKDRRASRENQHGLTVFRSEAGLWTVRQIVGPLVRRISTWPQPGQEVARGERLGLMKFGSRLDVTLPAHSVEPLVQVGQRVVAGETPIARWKAADETRRLG